MSVTVDVPATIPLTKVCAFLTDLGVPTTDLRELAIGPRGTYVEVYAHDEKGRRYFDRASGEIAVHRIAIPLDRDS